MVLKRNIREGDDEGSEFSPNEPKRHHTFGGIIMDSMNERSLQELLHQIEPRLRCWVREEVERGIHSSLRSSPDHIGSSGSRTSQLHFDDRVPSVLFTGSAIASDHSRPIRVVLRDATSKQVIATGPLSSVKIKIIALDGSFNPDDREDWTEQEFDRKIIREREGKRPLVTGSLVIQLRDGIGYVSDICFTDNSSWIRGGKFRLGAKVHAVSEGVRIREGVSEEFKVKDHRGESYKKHYPPSMDDEVWRLEKIAKDGVLHKRLARNGISTVKEFLWLYATNPNFLRTILENGATSEKRWKAIIDHANSCVLNNNELYMYGAAEGIGVVFNSILRVIGVIFDCQNFQSLDKLDIFQKQKVESLKQSAYKNTGHLVQIDGQSVVGFSGFEQQLPSPQANSFGSPCLYPHNVNLPVEQDQVEVQTNSDHTTISPSYTCEMEEINQFEVSAVESSHRMQGFNPALRNSFSLTDAYCGLNTDGYCLYPYASMTPLMSSDHLALNDNFQVEEPAMQGNGLFTVSSGINISRNIKPRARWCKIRAVIKWLTVLRQKWLLNELQEFCR